MIGDRLFTSFCWPENVYKPILYPVCTSAGTEITRGFPLKPKEGERNDHIHQVGIWLNYGKVNGLDLWGNGHRGFKEPNGGEIKHLNIEKLSGGKGEGVLITNERWIDSLGKELLTENTEHHFIVKGKLRIIDRITSLKATTKEVFFDDTKEGMFGIRVARQLEMPVNEMIVVMDATGKPTAEKVNASVGATGNYRSSEGITGEGVWGTRAKWMDLYGLFAANPFGWNDFTNGKEKFNFSLKPGQTLKFRYRIIISSGIHLPDQEINDLSAEFSGKYQ
ncbi:MAG: PmoA family protein [Bacteroidales bacterium]|jgi:hypothetical protein|nr:PmoA family protein [Bacteroidales bacterium]